jgi:hypothetical protein
MSRPWIYLLLSVEPVRLICLLQCGKEVLPRRGQLPRKTNENSAANEHRTLKMWCASLFRDLPESDATYRQCIIWTGYDAWNKK